MVETFFGHSTQNIKEKDKHHEGSNHIVGQIGSFCLQMGQPVGQFDVHCNKVLHLHTNHSLRGATAVVLWVIYYLYM